MRYRSIGLTLLGGLIFGLTLLSVVQLYPQEPCRGVDCGIRLFGLLPELFGTVVGSLFLAAGTFELATDRRTVIRLLWFPVWGLICGGFVGTYVGVFGPYFPLSFYWLPIIVGGVVGVLSEIWLRRTTPEQPTSPT